MAERQSPKAWIGWQGIRLRVPADWTIGQISGDADDGALRIDSANTPRVQVKWKKRGSGVVDIDRTLQDYVNALTKRRKREDAKIDVQLGGKHLSRRKKKKSQLRCFSWRGEQQAYGAAWHCSECDRTVICQVLGHLDEELESLAQEVLLSLEDHPQDGWTMWATYGLECWTPQDFDLADQKLMAGLIELRFARETEKIVIRRWGMSDIALRGKDLQQWAKQELVKGLKLYDWSAESTTFRGHEALRLSGGPRFLAQKMQRFFHHIALKPYGSVVGGLLWHCQPEKKIFEVECVLDEEHVALADEVCEHVVCHPTAEGREAMEGGA